MPQPNPNITARIPADLYTSARTTAGLPDNASHGQVMRWALAVATGQDPAEWTYMTPGWPTGRHRDRGRARPR